MINDTILPGEHHPSADNALRWFVQWKLNMPQRYLLMKESMASAALANNRLAEICLGTLLRLEKGEPVSDRYLLGLVWLIRDSQDLWKR